MEANKLKVEFTGSGQEYFRIWIVNLLLTVVTLGIYSAWAKVRRQQYFDRNTQLEGVCFDYHANPLSILAGRIIAVSLLLGYQYGVGASANSAFVAVATVVCAGPLLLQRALSFRLRNTSYRGVRFGFTGSVGDAYTAYMPTIFILLSPTLLMKVQVHPKWLGLSLLMFLLWPLAHSAIKHFQHSHLVFGDRAATYSATTASFYKAYSRAVGAGLVAVLLAMTIAIGVMYGIGELGKQSIAALNGKNVIVFMSAVLAIYAMFLFAIPYLQVCIGNKVWNHTAFPGVRFHSSMRSWTYIKLQSRNVALTLLTLGLYRPFAVVNTYAYRLAHVELETESSFDHVIANYAADKGNASGDGAADMFGFDLSW